MSSLLLPARGPSAQGVIAFHRPSPAALAACACLALGLVLTWDRTLDVWRTGAFFDTDDATRALQVRAWLGGQGWFDLRIPRMDPPDGVLMHWSRIVDLPLAMLVRLGELALTPEQAERFARLAFPALMLLLLYAATGWAGRILGGPRGGLLAVILAFMGAPFLEQFQPGRIDHHAPQIVLLVLATGAALASFHPARARLAALSGSCLAVSLGISLENLPFALVIAGAFPALFIWRGTEGCPALLAFAGGLSTSLLIVFAAFVPPSEWTHAACDTYSAAHLAPALTGVGVLLLLAFLSPRLGTTTRRALAVAILSPAPLVALAWVAPKCVGDPFVGLDPLVRDLWLRHTAEVEPFSSYLAAHPWSGLGLGAPVLLALAAAMVMAWKSAGIRRAQHLLLAALIAVGFALTFWGIRVFSSVLPIAAMAAAPAILALAGRIRMRTTVGRLAVIGLAALPFSPLAYALFLPDFGAKETASLSCLRPAAFGSLSAMPPGLVLAPIDAGAHLLAFTPHAVLGSPYHRNNHGNRLVLDALLAPAGEAEAVMRHSGAKYLVICKEQGSAKVLARHAPSGLAADLLADRIPGWLERVPSEGSQAVFRLR